MRLPWVRRSVLDSVLTHLRVARDEKIRLAGERNEAWRERDAARRASADLGLKLADAEAELAQLRAVPDPMEGLTADEIRDLLDTFAKGGDCKTCGGIHVRSCPRVKSVEYDRQGDKVSIKRVDFWRKWDDSGVIFSDMLPDPDEIAEETEPE